ncbi:hypothetical protein T11_8895 [Trichinella zimbabwensis]|uniref:Reverse transcriptase RNase H-like domain-containing protein n=1 Tax=Trichinella zimbabwensis TaxID=268475 RepID=A0A0V1I9A9_9BILA|nr:hypothetical protein T11_8895 [Trichinella zimbabwensis]
MTDVVVLKQSRTRQFPLEACYNGGLYGKLCHCDMRAPEWLEKLEDFLYTIDVSASNYGVDGRYPLSDATWRELYPVGTRRDNSLHELKRSTATQSSMERRRLPEADQRRPRMDAILLGKDDFGRMNLVRNRIETARARPIKQPLRRLLRGPSGPRCEEKGWPRAICVDYRKLNALMRIDDTLDLASGCWKVEVAKADRLKRGWNRPREDSSGFNLPFIVDMDVSEDAVVAVLSQETEAARQLVVACASHAPSQCATKKEVIALSWDVRCFRPFVYEYDFNVVHQHGQKHWNAGVLSRSTFEQSEAGDTSSKGNVVIMVFGPTSST